MTLSATSQDRFSTDDPSRLRVLVVCTGNICRSPAVEMLMRRATVEVSSAGTRALNGNGMHPFTVEALAERGLNDSSHVARQLDSVLIGSADVVLTAERAHRVPVIRADPTAVRRTFTLAEFARLAPMALDAPELKGSGRWHGLVARAASLRGVGAPANPADDDLTDPIAGGPDDHRSMVARALSLVDAIIGPISASAARPRQ